MLKPTEKSQSARLDERVAGLRLPDFLRVLDDFMHFENIRT